MQPTALELIIIAVAIIGNLTVGLFTYYKNQKSHTNRLFFLFIFTLIAYLVSNFFASYQTDNSSLFFWVKNIMTIAPFINLAFFLFVDTFPKNKIRFTTTSIIFMVLATFFVAILAQFGLIFSEVTYTPAGSQSIPGPAMPLFLIHTLGFLGAGFASMTYKLKKTSSFQKAQLKFLLLGTILMFLAILTTNFLFIILFNTANFINYLPIYTLIFVAFVSYAIVRHRFLDINLLVVRTISFSLITLVIVVAYALIIFSATNLVSPAYRDIVLILFAVVLAYSFNPLRHLIENATGNIFFKDQYSPQQVLERLGSIMQSTISLSVLTGKILEVLKKTLHFTHAAFIVTTDSQIYTQNSVGYQDELHLEVKNIKALAEAAGSQPLVFEEQEEGELKELMRKNSISIVVPLTTKNAQNGLLIVGQKASGDIYNNQDLQMFEILTPQLAIAVQNTLSYDQIKQFNITLKKEVQRATKDLKKANKELRRLDKLKDEFVYIATHELKNPVTAMRGYLSLMKEGTYGELPQKMKEPVEQLIASNQQLVNLVNDLLQIARSEADTVKVRTEPVNLCNVIDATLSSLKPIADQKNLQLKHVCPKDLPLVSADEDRLREVINNLVSNAIKYSQKGTIEITHVLDDENHVVTHVKDQGVGISKEDQEKLFTRFFRAPEQAAKGIPGTGLGLFIVKQLVERMKGRIWFTSELGKGSTFSFSLPKVDAKAEAKTVKDSKEQKGSQSQQNETPPSPQQPHSQSVAAAT